MAKANKQAERGVTQVSQGGEAPKERGMIVVPVDIRPEDLLSLDEKDEVDLVFDPELMPDLDDEVLQKLSYVTKRAYFVAWGAGQRKREERARERDRKDKPPTLWVNDPLDVAQARRSKLLRPRKGWHQTTCRNDEFDEFMSVGYRVIRQSKEGKDEAPGEETGEVLKVKEDEKITIIAVEIPEDVYHQHLRAVSYKSHARYSHDVESTFREFVEGKNRDYATKKEQLEVISEFEEGEEKLETG